MRLEHRSLLPAAGRQAEHVEPRERIGVPRARHDLGGGEHQLELARGGALVSLVGDGRAPRPAVGHPRVDHAGVVVYKGVGFAHGGAPVCLTVRVMFEAIVTQQTPVSLVISKAAANM